MRPYTHAIFLTAEQVAGLREGTMEIEWESPSLGRLTIRRNVIDLMRQRGELPGA